MLESRAALMAHRAASVAPVSIRAFSLISKGSLVCVGAGREVGLPRGASRELHTTSAPPFRDQAWGILTRPLRSNRAESAFTTAYVAAPIALPAAREARAGFFSFSDGRLKFSWSWGSDGAADAAGAEGAPGEAAPGTGANVIAGSEAIPFRLSPADALEAYGRWSWQESPFFRAKPVQRLRPIYAPFWVFEFDLTVRDRATGKVLARVPYDARKLAVSGTDDRPGEWGKGASSPSTNAGAAASSTSKLTSGERNEARRVASQVYGGYEYNRLLVDILKAPALFAQPWDAATMLRLPRTRAKALFTALADEEAGIASAANEAAKWASSVRSACAALHPLPSSALSSRSVARAPLPLPPLPSPPLPRRSLPHHRVLSSFALALSLLPPQSPLFSKLGTGAVLSKLFSVASPNYCVDPPAATSPLELDAFSMFEAVACDRVQGQVRLTETAIINALGPNAAAAVKAAAAAAEARSRGKAGGEGAGVGKGAGEERDGPVMSPQSFRAVGRARGDVAASEAAGSLAHTVLNLMSKHGPPDPDSARPGLAAMGEARAFGPEAVGDGGGGAGAMGTVSMLREAVLGDPGSRPLEPYELDFRFDNVTSRRVYMPGYVVEYQHLSRHWRVFVSAVTGHTFGLQQLGAFELSKHIKIQPAQVAGGADAAGRKGAGGLATGWEVASVAGFFLRKMFMVPAALYAVVWARYALQRKTQPMRTASALDRKWESIREDELAYQRRLGPRGDAWRFARSAPIRDKIAEEAALAWRHWLDADGAEAERAAAAEEAVKSDKREADADAQQRRTDRAREKARLRKLAAPPPPIPTGKWEEEAAARARGV